VARADPYIRHGPDQQGWCSRVADDYDNIRAAIALSVDQAPDIAADLVGNLAFFLWLRGGFAEAATWLDACLAHADTLAPARLSRLHECGSIVSLRLGDIDKASRHADEAYSVAASAGDDRGVTNALRERAKVAASRGETDVVRTIYTELEAVADRVGDAWNSAVALNNLGDLALQRGDWREVVDRCGRSSEIRRSMGDLWGSALATVNVAAAQLELGELGDAARSLRVALKEGDAVGATTIIAFCFDFSAVLASAIGRPIEAARLLGAAARLYDELGAVRDDPYEQRATARTTDSLKASLGSQMFAGELELGRSVSHAEATELTLIVLAAASRSTEDV
jgi:tetratricopeptide (TPR) repeat protein